MTISEAKNMIASAELSSAPQTWLDLGCGRGTFTLALAELLPSGSTVIGVDTVAHNLPRESSNGVNISFIQADFSQGLEMSKVDGIMMANALHYIANPAALLDRLVVLMAQHPQFLIIEYDTEASKPWVPYPITFHKMRKLFEDKGMRIMKTGERTSVFGGTKMYAIQAR